MCSSDNSVPKPSNPAGVWGLRNFFNPASGSGLIITISAPAFFAACNVVSMRGWFVPGFWPTTRIRSASAKSSIVTVPLPTPIVVVNAEPLDS